MSGPVFQPIFDRDGLFISSAEEVESHCVLPFGENFARADIWNGFKQLLTELGTLDAFVEIWIDGSFVEKKPNPRDIDVVIIVRPTSSADIKDAYTNIHSRRDFFKRTWRCDIDIFLEHEIGCICQVEDKELFDELKIWYTNTSYGARKGVPVLRFQGGL